jgi:heat shock protein HtpX
MKTILRKNVYTHIAENNWKIFGLVLLFPLALSFFIYLAFLFMGFFSKTPEEQQQIMDLFWEVSPWLIFICFFWTLLSVFMGDKMMLAFAGAKPCEAKDKENLKIYRAVENVALAAGLPTPKVYLINDDSLNAFATGYSPKSASIALTTGIVKKLEPLELDAVIAHEMAHIKNRDIRLNMYVITGIGVVGLLGEIMIRMWGNSSRSRDDKNNLQILFIVLGFSLLLFRVLIAPFIHMAISRRQEYQADATGAFFTRNPEALASALEKIAVDPRVEVLDGSQQMAAACIYNPLKKVKGLLSTHPPVEERIKRLRSMV